MSRHDRVRRGATSRSLAGVTVALTAASLLASGGHAAAPARAAGSSGGGDTPVGTIRPTPPVAGPVGPTGPSGATPVVVSGTTGASSTTGTTGVAAPVGATGPTNTATPSGPTGVTGPSAALPPTPSRHPTAARKRPPRTITLNWVGDIAFNTSSGLPPGGLARAFAPVRPTLRSGDLTLGNLEGTLSTGGVSKCGGSNSGDCFAFQAPTSFAQGLRDSGFTIMNMANNHSYDYGAGGQAQTLAALRGAGLAHDGLNGETTLLHVRGIRVAVIGFAPYPWANNLLDITHAASLVRHARREASIVIVVIHAGAEGVAHDHTPAGTEYDFGENRGDPRAFAHAVIDAGASIVVGSGPHVLRGIERYHGHMAAYSLGNFAAWRTLGLGGLLSDSAILHVTLSVATGKVVTGRLVPLRLLGAGLPQPDPTDASDTLVNALSREDFGADRYRLSGRGTISP